MADPLRQVDRSCNVVPRLPLLLGVPDDGVAAGSEDRGEDTSYNVHASSSMKMVLLRQTQRKVAKLAVGPVFRHKKHGTTPWPDKV